MSEHKEGHETKNAPLVMSDPILYSVMAGDEAQGDKKKFARYLHEPRKTGAINLHDVSVEAISPMHPDFDKVYALLYKEFGEKGEIETKEVLETRSKWDALHPENGKPPLEYRIVILKHPYRTLGDNRQSEDQEKEPVYGIDGQEIVGVRDHNLIYKEGMIIAHMSHSYLIENARGKGLDTVLRAIPVVDAKAFAEKLGHPDASIILYTEQEPVPTLDEIQESAYKYYQDGSEAEIDDINMRFRRLAAYQGGSFLKIGIQGLAAQPDFSTPEQITAKGGPTMVGLNGIWRFVGHENTTKTTGRIVRIAVSAVYDMYEASGLDKRSIALARDLLNNYPPDEAEIPLLRPIDPIP